MDKTWCLYWVALHDGEGCFVAARNTRSARRLEIEMNDIDPADVTAERVCKIPKDVEQRYFKKFNKHLSWPSYIYGSLIFEGVGAQFRTIEGKRQMLLDEIVYQINSFDPPDIERLYPVGRKSAIKFHETHELSSYPVNDHDYFGPIAPEVYEMIGRCLVRCQEIEDLISRSFIFGTAKKHTKKYRTIDDMQKGWRKKTFGQLLQIIKDGWHIHPDVERALDMFNEHRNLFVHRLISHPRYDATTNWGVLELIPFVQFFDLQTRIVRNAFDASVLATIDFAQTTFGMPDEAEKYKFTSEEEDQIAYFLHCFEPKDG